MIHWLRILQSMKRFFRTVKNFIKLLREDFVNLRKSLIRHAGQALWIRWLKPMLKKWLLKICMSALTALAIPRQLMRLHLDGQARKQRKISVLYWKSRTRINSAFLQTKAICIRWRWRKCQDVRWRIKVHWFTHCVKWKMTKKDFSMSALKNCLSPFCYLWQRTVILS